MSVCACVLCVVHNYCILELTLVTKQNLLIQANTWFIETTTIIILIFILLFCIILAPTGTPYKIGACLPVHVP